MPRDLVRAAERDGRLDWLATLPGIVGEVAARWGLTVGQPFEPGGHCAWVAPASDSTGAELVLKVGWPHDEADHEADGLRTWAGDGAVLPAEREPWLVIDPKPYVGDPTYDVLQHMMNCSERLQAAPHDLAWRMADLAGLDRDRVLLWLFARCVQESADWPELAQVARRIGPA